MKKLIILFSCLFLTIHVCRAEEFIYPVAQIDDKNIFIVHQRSLDDMRLFLWNMDSKVATKELSSMFLPSHIKLLPSKTGFSFIDRGRIRIKMFQKRTPKAIDIFEPIDSIISMHWINDTQFYGVGKYLRHYKVFLYDISKSENQLYQVTDFDSTDYLYPFKVDDLFFCIIKDTKQLYYVTEQSWYPTLYEEFRESNPATIIMESSEPLCFLHMNSAREGYFLQCNIHDTSNEHFLNFSCYNCIKQEDNWAIHQLFSFKLPMDYIVGESEQRAYESIYPFLPNYQDSDRIYFVDYNDQMQNCMIYTYYKSSGLIAPTVQTKSIIENIGFLSPCVLPDAFCYGLILPTKKALRAVLQLDQETGILNVDLPLIVQK